ncbi:LysR family transcriptional regulator [Candidatus Pantoea formicae]|uniref:LysR family transcriptional regulator n=1 Tax=Candidatus Pantoea formicae TaxID=2608355 RepID=UPI003EDA6D9D
MQVFAKVVETGSFSAAAKLLELTPSAVSKLVSRIEERLGTLLLQRSTRQLVLTIEGRQFYDSCVRILGDIEEAEQGIATGKTAAHGTLRVNVSLPFGTHQILPLIAEFCGRHPAILLDLSLTDALVDLQRERVDVAIRMGTLADASFQARSLGKSRLAVVAAPAYLKTFGTPRHPDALFEHRCFNFNFRRTRDEWPFQLDGQTVHRQVGGGMLVNNGETMRLLTLQGLGISRLALFHVGKDLAEGSLVELLQEFNPGDLEDIHAIFRNQRYMPQRVRVFIDFLVEKLAHLK